MNTFTKLSLEAALLMALAMTLTSAPVAAEAGYGPCGGPPPFAEFDADGNGFLSQEEFEAGRTARHAAMAKEGRPMMGMENAPAFTDFDTDADGQLSEDEFATGHYMHMQKMHAGEHEGKHGMGHGKPHAEKAHMTFEAIDTDNDGCISRAEFDKHHAAEPKAQ